MIKEKKRQEDLTYVSSQLSKRLKSSFGKGPDSCFSTFEEGMLYIHIRKFITPSEEVLLKRNKKGLALTYRNVILEAIIEDLKIELNKIFKVSFTHFFQDWDFDTNSGLLLMMTTSYNPPHIKNNNYSINNNLIIEKIQNAYIEAYKKPNDITISQINENIYVAECKHNFLPIELELYKQGNYEILLNHSYDIKRRLTEYKPLFISAFKRIVNDIFVMWDYDEDKNIVVFFVK
ncbi:Na-translocating system protein MpsC family protein [Evansella sp. AB-rgal1]|uniref:Na-translocating system protein MpsC family protein n=1 Tax=Evansella sp. AB-rgal1 TaxID=3242696 RepID=UPI00359E0B18